MAASNTPDFSPSPRQSFEEIDLEALPYSPGDPVVLYLDPDSTTGSSTISFTPWDGHAVTDVPIFSAGKFDLCAIRSLDAVNGVTAAWGAY